MQVYSKSWKEVRAGFVLGECIEDGRVMSRDGESTIPRELAREGRATEQVPTYT